MAKTTEWPEGQKSSARKVKPDDILSIAILRKRLNSLTMKP